MFTWIELSLLLLRLVNQIMSQINMQTNIRAGADAEIAKIAASILRKTQAGKKIMERVDAMSNADVDAALIGLEPK